MDLVARVPNKVLSAYAQNLFRILVKVLTSLLAKAHDPPSSSDKPKFLTLPGPTSVLELGSYGAYLKDDMYPIESHRISVQRRYFEG